MSANRTLWGVETLAQDLVREVLHAAPASVASVALWDRPSFALTLKAIASLRPMATAPVGQRYALSRSPWRRAAVERAEPIVLDPAMLAEDRAGAGNGDNGHAPSLFQSAYLVPIRIGDTVLGVLELDEMRAPERDSFTPEKRDRIQSFLDEFVSASAHAWTAERLRRQLRSTSSLLRLVQAMREAPTFQSVLNSSLTELGEWLGMPVSGVLFGTGGTGELTMLARTGLQEPPDPAGARQLVLALARMGSPLRSPVSVVPVADDPLDPYQGSVPPGQVWTRLGIPLMRQDRLIGLACYYVADDVRPGDLELEALRHRGEILALGVELVGAVHDHRRHRDWLGRVLGDVLTTYPATLVEYVLEEIGRSVPAQAAALPAAEGGATPELTGAPVGHVETLRHDLGSFLDRLRERRAGVGAPVDVNQVVELALDVARLGGCATVSVDFKPAAVPLRATASPALVAALLHVIQSAVEATPAGGQVRVRTEVENGHVLVLVGDAVGEASGQPRAVDLDPVDSPKDAPYSGLGLSVARALAARHGGGIDVGAEGGRCVVRLPRQEG